MGKENINHNAQEMKQHNPDDLNTRFIQINNQPFSLIIVLFYRVRIWFLRERKKKIQKTIHEVWFGALVTLDLVSEDS